MTETKINSMHDVMITDYSDIRFQNAFKQYFKDLDIIQNTQTNVVDWDGCFREFDEDKGVTFMRVSADDQVIGFVLTKEESLKNWFFEEKIGFIREIWVAEEHRKTGQGRTLLQKAENYFKERGIYKTILTTDTASTFYKKCGYHQDISYNAKNKDDVFVKYL